MGGRLRGQKEWNKLVKNYGEQTTSKLAQAFRVSAMELAAYSRDICPVSPVTAKRGGFEAATPSGRLRQSITHEVTLRPMMFIGAWGTNVEYAKHVEFGTDPHPISARRVKLLRFYPEPEEIMFKKRVSHPGVTVGTPQSPSRSWKKKQVWGGDTTESMPFLRPAWAELGPSVMRRIKVAGQMS